MLTAAVLVVVALVGMWLVRPLFLTAVLGYLVFVASYAFGLNRLVMLDVFALAADRVLHAAGGAIATDVPISP